MQEKPVDLLPDPHFLYMSSGHDNAYTHLEYAIHENKGFVVISGEVGCGKTTLINYLLRKVPTDLHVGLISHTDVDPELFFKLVCRKFELTHNSLDKGEMIATFQDFLLEAYRNHKRVALIIDEAQNLPDRTLEEIRMLSNLEAEKEHLIQMVLVGQPELRQKLRRPHLRQLLQRVTVHYHLEGLKNQAEINEYIRHRLHISGCPHYATLFSDEALDAVWIGSQGIPRIINYLCDLALVHGYADGLTTINEKTIYDVIKIRSESSLFTADDQEPTQSDYTSRPEPENSQVTTDALTEIRTRISFIESIIESQASQLQELGTSLSTRDRLILEIFHLTQQSLEKRWDLNTNYQKALVELNRLREKLSTVEQKLRTSGGDFGTRNREKKSFFKKLIS